MSIFTVLERDEIQRLATAFGAGEVAGFSGIHEGVENTNYRVVTTRGEFVLTVLEAVPPAGARFCLEVMERLAQHRLPAPRPLRLRSGKFIATARGKPVAMVRYLHGTHPGNVETGHCSTIGTALARMHQALAQWPVRRRNPRGPTWRRTTAARVRPRLSAADQALLDRALDIAQRFDRRPLPRGIIHADLFRDNALFVGDKLTGVLDFFYACDGALIYDLAVAAIDWCRDADTIDAARSRALIDSYQERRLLSQAELRIWPGAVTTAALRFWLSRLADKHFPRPGLDVQVKDPEEFGALLRGLV
jgi:homoserine kinase type II